MKNILNRKHLFVILILLFLFLALFINLSSKPESKIPVINTITKPSGDKFLSPGKDWPSPEKVEDYLLENFHNTPEEIESARSTDYSQGRVMFRIREHMTLEDLLDHLEHYGFVRDKEALRYALNHTEDTHEGKAHPLVVGDKTITTWAYYGIREDMTAWEIADILLNHPTYFTIDEYNERIFSTY